MVRLGDVTCANLELLIDNKKRLRTVLLGPLVCRAKGHTYGKLAPQAINSAAAADGEADFATRKKRHPSDFALWKQAKPGEPAWESPECARDHESAPLGKGRPGVVYYYLPLQCTMQFVLLDYGGGALHACLRLVVSNICM